MQLGVSTAAVQWHAPPAGLLAELGDTGLTPMEPSSAVVKSGGKNLLQTGDSWWEQPGE